MKAYPYYWNKLYCTCFCALFRVTSPLKACRKNNYYSRENAICYAGWNNQHHHVHCDLTLLIQKELHKANRCAVISEIADFLTGSPEREQPGRSTDTSGLNTNIQLILRTSTHTHTHIHTHHASNYNDLIIINFIKPTSVQWSQLWWRCCSWSAWWSKLGRYWIK